MIRLAIAASMAATSALPLAASETFATKGPGRAACVELPADERGRRDLAARILGYVSASNRLTEATFDLAPWQTADVLLAQVSRYCAAFPDATVTDAVDELLDWLHRERLTRPEQPVAVRTSTSVVVLYPSTLEKVQSKLADHGHAPLDRMDDLIAALRAYQTAQDLPVTGLPDTPTLLSLLQDGQQALEPNAPAD